MRIKTTINGQLRELDFEPGDSLLDVLRANGVKGVKQGCDHEGTCGACTVLLDDEPVLSCMTPAARVAGRQVVTVEGLGTPTHPHILQEAFVDAGAVQCGYCTPGMILSSKALLDRNPTPSREDIAEALSGNLCRCTGYVKIMDAVHLAAERMQEKQNDEH